MHPSELNSVHLDAGRLANFRLARENLLRACGSETLQISGEALQDQLQKLRRIGVPHSSSSRTKSRGDPPPKPFVTINQRQRLDLKYGHNTVGRLPDNDIVGCDGFLSRRHCAILVHSDDSCELHDLASKNGTFLNGVRIKEPTLLSPGDEIKLGDLQICFMASAGPGQAARPKADPIPDQTCVLADSKVA